MSKSKGNVVSPDDMIARYGADATRMYALFAAPPDRDLDWQEDGVAGVSRFLGRVYRLVMRYGKRCAAGQARLRLRPTSPLAQALLRKLHQTITQDHPGFCRALALQHLHRGDHGAGERDHRRRAGVGGDAGGGFRQLMATILPSLILLLAPFAPYLAAELWSETGGAGVAPAPAVADLRSGPAHAKKSWKCRCRSTASCARSSGCCRDAGSEAMQQAALAEAKVQAAIAGKQVVKVVVVPGKLINIVVK